MLSLVSFGVLLGISRTVGASTPWVLGLATVLGGALFVWGCWRQRETLALRSLRTLRSRRPTPEPA